MSRKTLACLLIGLCSEGCRHTTNVAGSLSDDRFPEERQTIDEVLYPFPNDDPVVKAMALSQCEEASSLCANKSNGSELGECLADVELFCWDRPENAVKGYTEAISDAPMRAYPYYGRAMAYLDLVPPHYLAACQDLREYWKRSEGDLERRVGVADQLHHCDTGEPDKILDNRRSASEKTLSKEESYDQGNGTQNRESASVETMLGMAENNVVRGEFDKARIFFSESLHINPRICRAHYHLARLSREEFDKDRFCQQYLDCTVQSSKEDWSELELAIEAVDRQAHIEACQRVLNAEER